MPQPTNSLPDDGAWLARRPKAIQWFLLLLLTIVLSGLLTLADLPAALLLGSLISAIALSSAGCKLDLPQPGYAFSQGLVGCLIALTLPLTIFDELVADGLVLLLGVAGVILVASLLGLAVARSGALPGTTAVWGLSPGAASVMTMMSEHYGADARLVAFLQYTRVLIVIGFASLVARIVGAVDPEAVGAVPPVVWFPPLDWIPFLETLALAAAGVACARLPRLPTAALLLPLMGGILLGHLELVRITLPHWLMALAYTAIGWRIGLRFDRQLLLYAIGTLPAVIASSLALIAACGGIAGLLVLLVDIDPLTAYLATSPGGVDTVAIIAASSHVDQPFIMAMQTLRFILLLALGPYIAKLTARLAKA